MNKLLLFISLLIGTQALADGWGGGLTDYLGNPILLGPATMSTSVPVTMSSNQTGINTFLDKSGTGTITTACTTPPSCPANSTVTATTNGASTAYFNILGTWVATLIFEGQDGNGSWAPILGTIAGQGGGSASTGINNPFVIPCGGFNQVRVRASAYVSGTVTANWNVGAGSNACQVFNLTASGLQMTATQGASLWLDNITQFGGTNLSTGTGAGGAGIPRVTASNDSKILIWDGTNTSVVRAGSSQAVLADSAFVVTERPDNVGTPTQTSVSCAATTTTLLAANAATMFLSVRNPTTSAVTIWINTAGAAAVAAAPSMDLPPGSEAYFSAEGSSFLPTDQINCISSGGASSVTITYK